MNTVLGYVIVSPAGMPVRGPDYDGKPGRVLIFTTEDRAKNAVKVHDLVGFAVEPVIRGRG